MDKQTAWAEHRKNIWIGPINESELEAALKQTFDAGYKSACGDWVRIEMDGLPTEKGLYLGMMRPNPKCDYQPHVFWFDGKDWPDGWVGNEDQTALAIEFRKQIDRRVFCGEFHAEVQNILGIIRDFRNRTSGPTQTSADGIAQDSKTQTST